MPQPVTLVCGVAGAGKSWICRQLTEQYLYVPHDRCWTHPTARPGAGLDVAWGPPGSKSTHFSEVLRAALAADRPVLTEAPFGERALRDHLEAAGVKVRAVFVVEDAATIRKRFLAREGSMPSAGVMTRLEGLKARAIEWNAFWGTSAAVLAHLRGLGSARTVKRGRL